MEPPEERAIMEKTCARLREQGWAVEKGWDVVKGKSQYGTGDILARKGKNILAIECKYINSTNRTKKRKKVKDQALLYASFAKLKHLSHCVKGYWCTNETVGNTGWLGKRQAQSVCANHLFDANLWWNISAAARKSLYAGLSPTHKRKFGNRDVWSDDDEMLEISRLVRALDEDIVEKRAQIAELTGKLNRLQDALADLKKKRVEFERRRNSE